MRAIFVTGTGTDVGKTYVTAQIARALVRKGIAVDVLKPVVSGFDPAAPQGSDPWILIEACGRAPTREEIDRVAPFQFRAPLSPPLAATLEGRSLDAGAIIDLCKMRRRETPGVLLIEGAGGVMSPVDDRNTVLDVMSAVGAPAILIAGSYLGTISHTLTAIEVIRARGVELLEVVVCASIDGPPLHETCDAIETLSGVQVAIVARNGRHESRWLFDGLDAQAKTE